MTDNNSTVSIDMQMNSPSNTPAPIGHIIDLIDLYNEAVQLGFDMGDRSESRCSRFLNLVLSILEDREGRWTTNKDLKVFLENVYRSVEDESQKEGFNAILDLFDTDSLRLHGPDFASENLDDLMTDPFRHEESAETITYLIGIALEALGSDDPQLAVSILRQETITYENAARLTPRLTGVYIPPPTMLQLQMNPEFRLYVVDSACVPYRLALRYGDMERVATSLQPPPPGLDGRRPLHDIPPGILSGITNRLAREGALESYKKSLQDMFTAWKESNAELYNQILYLQDIERAWVQRIADPMHLSIFLPPPPVGRGCPLTHRQINPQEAVRLVREAIAKRQVTYEAKRRLKQIVEENLARGLDSMEISPAGNDDADLQML